jgi:hypothetical protein
MVEELGVKFDWSNADHKVRNDDDKDWENNLRL